jgi:preprotein translocase subunit SecD
MFGRWGNRLLLIAILGATALSIVTVWPDDPDRYLPFDDIAYPSGKGIKFPFITVEGNTFKGVWLKREGMSLGLDLRGGTRLVLAPEQGFSATKDQLEGAKKVIERRVNEFGVAESEVNTLSGDQLSVALPGISPEEAIDKIGRTALLQFCEPLTNEGGDVATLDTGTVTYEPQSCEPKRDPQGNIEVEGGGTVQFQPAATGLSDRDKIVWTPSKGDLDGVETELTGRFLDPPTLVQSDQVGQPTLVFQWTDDGAHLSEQVTGKLSSVKFPLAVFLDGEPIRGADGKVIAPTVQSTITSSGQITGLERGDANELSTLLNTGSFPVPLRVVQQQDVDATLGDTAVKNSVIAGQVALLVIMLFMVLYYRLPGLMAACALMVYTCFALAIFKVVPVTLTLAGIAAFVLSLGMAVDANILIFERMKEELRVGRSLRNAMDDGFNRAWSSIRDSNVSSIITAVILYWFGNQFAEPSIKGFALVWIVGVGLSMFSAITVSRCFLRFVVQSRWVANHLWMFMADPPEAATRPGLRGAPAPVRGGSGEDAK